MGDQDIFHRRQTTFRRPAAPPLRDNLKVDISRITKLAFDKASKHAKTALLPDLVALRAGNKRNLERLAFRVIS